MNANAAKPPKIGLSFDRQNLAAEIRKAATDLATVRACKQADETSIAALDRCEELLQDARDAHQGFFPRRLFIYELLFKFRQELVWLLPDERIRVEMLDFEEASEGEGDRTTGNPIRVAHPTEQDLLQLRERLASNWRHRTKARVAGLWEINSKRRLIWIWVSLLVALLAVTAFRNLEVRTIELAFVFGMIGGTLSALTGVISERQAARPKVPWLLVPVLRPIVGATAGLFLFLAVDSGLLANFDPPTGTTRFYLLAIAFGFSERALLASLRSSADNLEQSFTDAVVANRKREESR